MSDPIAKFLAKVTEKEKIILSVIIWNILSDKLEGLNAKKLVGSKDIFRVRKGKFRIIYKRTATDCIIMSIERRSEKTYKDF